VLEHLAQSVLNGRTRLLGAPTSANLELLGIAVLLVHAPTVVRLAVLFPLLLDFVGAAVLQLLLLTMV